MADVTLTLPVNGGVLDVQPYLDAGDDVLLNDVGSKAVNCTLIKLSTDGTIKARERTQADADAHGQYYLAGGWHPVPLYKFFASGTTAALGLQVRGG